MKKDAFDIALLVGSLREASVSLRIAKALSKKAPTGLKIDIVSIADLPFYNQDLETSTPPEPWQRFRARISKCDAVLFVTPEYNRSIPAILKNALDVGSRPFGKGVWHGKPAAVVSLSPGLLGGAAAALHLRQVLGALGSVALPSPEVYLSAADKLVDDSCNFTNEGTEIFIKGFMGTFSSWIERFT